jgi:hypothetical protein
MDLMNSLGRGLEDGGRGVARICEATDRTILSGSTARTVRHERMIFSYGVVAREMSISVD